AGAGAAREENGEAVPRRRGGMEPHELGMRRGERFDHPFAGVMHHVFDRTACMPTCRIIQFEAGCREFTKDQTQDGAGRVFLRDQQMSERGAPLSLDPVVVDFYFDVVAIEACQQPARTVVHPAAARVASRGNSIKPRACNAPSAPTTSSSIDSASTPYRVAST